MHSKYLPVVAIIILLISCTEKAPKIELSNPGFGIIETQISKQSDITNLPVLIKTNQIVKGLQFTLNWDASELKVGQPKLTDLNSEFTVSVGKGSPGQMKVLVFSLSGGALNTSEPEFMSIPVNLLNTQAAEVSLDFNEAVFAGPNASTYDIPIIHAKLKVKRS